MSPRVIVHGGVDSPGGRDVSRALAEAASAAQAIIADGGDAVAAVEAAVWLLEADPLFNAGVGSVLNEDGEVETDASIADGSGGRFAGIAALQEVLHPISVAAELLRRAPGPVLLAGEGARRFAKEVGAQSGNLRTAEQTHIWTQARDGRAGRRSPFTGREVAISETVGSIAIDRHGRLAAGSSTGGILLKMQGRVGDAAVFGAGIYADDRIASLCSGLGEATIELSLGVRAASRYRHDWDLDGASTWAVELLNLRGAVGGIILFDAERDAVAVAHNAADFPVVTDVGDGPIRLEPVRVSGLGDG